MDCQRLVVFVLIFAGSIPAIAMGADAVNTWRGGYADDPCAWDVAQNWSAIKRPKDNDATKLIIPAGLKHYPVIRRDFRMGGTLVIEKGATVTVAGPHRLLLDPQDRKTAPLVLRGTLKLQDGATAWLGVVWGRGATGPDGRAAGERPVDAALVIRQSPAPDVLPDITPAAAPPDEPGVVKRMQTDVGPPLPPDVKLINLAPSAAIKTVPYMTMARTLVDPDDALRTVAVVEQGTPAKGMRYEFRYAAPQTVAAVQWAVVAGPWAILADKDGDGAYESLLRADLEGRLSNPGGVWRARASVNNTFWPPVKTFGIQIVSLLPSITDNRFYDVQILSPGGTAATPAPELEKGVAELQDGPPLDVPTPPVEKQYLKGFHIEPWMFNALGWIKAKDRVPLAEYKPMLEFIQGIRKMHGNFVNMWPPVTFEARGKGTYESDLLWPSQYDRHSLNENVLKTIADVMHANGITIFTMQRTCYPKKLEEFPETPTLKQPAPYVSRLAREYMAGVAREQAASGVDGVGAGFDEQYWSAVRNPKQANAETRKAFEERYHLPFPEVPDDTEAFRKWIVFAYQEFAAYLQQAVAAARSVNPKVLVQSPITTLDIAWNTRVDWGVAHDVVGHRANPDIFRASGYQDENNIGHYVTAANVERVAAANPKGAPDSLHNCPWASDPQKQPGFYLDFTPVYMYGPPISGVLHGARVPAYWRYNFTFYGGYDKYVEQAFSILDTLAAWGARQSTKPRTIAVIKSRASEDWWQIRQRYRSDGNPMDQTRGYLFEKWLLEFLLSNGYPFDMFYLDHPADWAESIHQYPLVILPFPYSMSQESFAAVRKAAESGKKVIAFDRKGETDEWGNAHARPLLEDLIAAGKVRFLDTDVPATGHYGEVQDQMRSLVDELLGPAKPLYFNPYGHDVEVGLREKGDREKYLFVINWREYPATVDLGVSRLPAGQYQVTTRGLAGAHAATLAGRQRFSAEDLRKFRLSLDKGGVKILYIHPAPGQ